MPSFAKLLILILFHGVFFVNAVKFKCDFRNIGWNVVGTVYTCRYPTSDSSSGNNSFLESVEGTHLSGKTNDDVLGLYVSGQNLPVILKNIENFFPNLIALAWESSGLTSVSAEDLRPFPKLRLLSFYTNTLINIDGDLFQYTPQLQWIHLGFNAISNVGIGAFDNLDGLIYLYFNSNPCFSGEAINNRTAVLELISKIELNCPTLTTSTTPTTTLSTTPAPIDFCQLSCIDDLNQTIDQLLSKNVAQEQKIVEQGHEIVELTQKVSNLTNLIEDGTLRLAELEKLMREINSRP